MSKREEYVAGFKIGNHKISNFGRTFLIAEVAQAHDGSLGLAHAFIDAAADNGADAIKFQTHFASEESTLDEPFRVKFSRQDNTRFEYWKRMEFTPEQWAGLAKHAQERGLVFLSSAFSAKAVALLEKLGMAAWKVASGELYSDALIHLMAQTGKPILLSSGMAGWADIDHAAQIVRRAGNPLAVFQCTTEYPTPLTRVGLNVIGEIRDRYACPAGLSDHSGKLWPAISAIANGAALLEFHVIFDRRMFGPDVKSSLTFEELRAVSEMRDAQVTMSRNPVNKNAAAEGFAALRQTFGKSLAVTRQVAAGSILTADVLTLKKPGTGIRAEDMHKVVGRRVAIDIQPDRLLRWADIQDS
ncbi:MAG: N-acetylneuraminate synthase family protein [Ferrovibrio sp.]